MYTCASPKLRVSPAGVSLADCSECYLRDHTDGCECTVDGHCSKYNRPMGTREREICRGENVDAGQAAGIRADWAREAASKVELPMAKCPYLGEPVKDGEENKKAACGPCGGKLRQVFQCTHPARLPDEVTVGDCAECVYRPRPVAANQRALILRNGLSPGDILAMTAAIRSLHLAHPGKFLVAAQTSADQLLEHNPDFVPRMPDGEEVEMHYPAVHQCNERGIHFMQGYCEFLSDVLKVQVPLLTNRPHVYLAKQEMRWMNQVQELGYKQPFWLVNSGRKSDFTAKHWGTSNFQTVVNALRGKVLFVQVGSAEHHHPPLEGAVDLRGKTDLRQLVRLCYHSKGVLSGVTLLQHLAAALEKPSVVVMGGREPVQWNSYPRQQLLHTVGALPCCDGRGCWKSRVVKLGDGSEQDASLCESPVPGAEPIGKCMALIVPEEVVIQLERLNTGS